MARRRNGNRSSSNSNSPSPPRPSSSSGSNTGTSNGNRSGNNQNRNNGNGNGFASVSGRDIRNMTPREQQQYSRQLQQQMNNAGFDYQEQDGVRYPVINANNDRYLVEGRNAWHVNDRYRQDQALATMRGYQAFLEQGGSAGNSADTNNPGTLGGPVERSSGADIGMTSDLGGPAERNTTPNISRGPANRNQTPNISGGPVGFMPQAQAQPLAQQTQPQNTGIVPPQTTGFSSPSTPRYMSSPVPPAPTPTTDPNGKPPAVHEPFSYSPDQGTTPPSVVDPTPNNGGNGTGGGNGGTGTGTGGLGAQIVPGRPNPNDPNQIGIVDASGQFATDPGLYFNDEMRQLANLQRMNVDAGLMDPNASWAQMDFDRLNIDRTNTPNIAAKDANTYDVATSFGQVQQNQMTGAQGTVSNGAQVTAAQADMQGLGTGVNQDGSTNYAGEALKKYASQNMINIIDTSTAAGKLLAQQLGEGNYTDSKATLMGQLQILQNEFVDAQTGEPKIPTWAAATARNVSKIAAFKGMTGSAATAAMSQALMEASIPVAQQEAQFYQTLTLQNLTNKQQSIINTANVLSKFEQTNVDNRMAAAIQNAKAFLEMDMTNLSNEQQASVINMQARIQSLLEDSKQENLKRNFVASSQNDMDKFYDELNNQINTFNSSQNTDVAKFNANLEDSREKFYKEMQFNINQFNAQWRQKVEVQEDQQQFEAAAADTKNIFDFGVNQLNQLWDRSDALLDYVYRWKENKLDARQAMALAVLQGNIQSDLADQEALGSLLGIGVSELFKGSGGFFGSSGLGLF